MFGKKRCENCGEKIKDSFNFCPYCRLPVNGNDEDWGMLGKNDFDSDFDAFSASVFGKAGGNMLGKMLNSALKMLEKEMQKEAKRVHGSPSQKNHPGTNVRLMINGKEIDLNNQQHKIQEKPRNSVKKLSHNTLKNFSALPKKEPSTNIRRLANKVIYEMSIPGVNSLDDISISQLENSIEIKAVTKKKAYSKIIPINLPIKNYALSNGKLVLELDARD